MSRYHKVSRAVNSLPPGVMSKDGVLLMSEANQNYAEIVDGWSGWGDLSGMFKIYKTTYRGHQVAIFAPQSDRAGMPPEQIWHKIEEKLAGGSLVVAQEKEPPNITGGSF